MLITMRYIMQHISKLPHYYSVVPKEIINFATFLNQNRKNMKAFVFPGQGAQFVGMGKDPVSYTHLTLPTNSLV